jgi:ubiquinone/menaquinone biosynthesis C-methylase UbiE
MPTKVKFDPKNKELLVSQDRRNALDVYKLLRIFPILSHHTVADVGCGPGFFTIPMAKMVFDGKIYALDIQDEMLDAVRAEVAKVNLTNVDVVKSQEKKLPLEDESIDGVVAAFVLQEATSPKTLLKEAMRCLKNHGWLVVLEWYKREMEEGPPVSQRIDMDEMKELTAKAGFRVRETRDLNGKQYMVMARK